ncbi:hypothetical protein EVAR_89500_1 [Eumeta japonica]|uniref:Uncharacterized protein n=1 Tax=Eumeta variegata TaxID=151549 RepID=A0A4C1SZR0_EUMVA|nr:hypothetical protein EVAR_89500_1 [Eumeta japonica]
MDVDHEKLLSGDVNFKWRDFTAFTAVEKSSCPPRWCDNDKQPLPNAKSKQPLAASNQPVTDCEEKTTKKVSTIVMKELRPGGQGQSRGQSIDAKVKTNV